MMIINILGSYSISLFVLQLTLEAVSFMVSYKLAVARLGSDSQNLYPILALFKI